MDTETTLTVFNFKVIAFIFVISVVVLAIIIAFFVAIKKNKATGSIVTRVTSLSTTKGSISPRELTPQEIDEMLRK